MNELPGSYRRFLLLLIGTVLHAGLTLVCFLLYVQTAMEASHGGQASVGATILQYIKALFLWPLLLPLLKSYPVLMRGWLGILFLLLNSFIWVSGLAFVWVIWRSSRGRRPA